MTRVNPIRRLLVACDLSEHGLAALKAAATLASRTHAELSGLFVEDEDFVRFAGLSSARVFHAGSTAAMRPDVAAMERELRASAERVRLATARVAEQVGIPWSFRVVRGRVTEVVLAAGVEADVIVLGRAGPTPRADPATGSTARKVAVDAPSSVLLMRRGEEVRGPFVVADDRSPAAERARALAEQLAQGGDGTIRVRTVPAADAGSLLSALRTDDAGTVFVPASADLEGLIDRLDEVPCPVWIVR